MTADTAPRVPASGSEPLSPAVAVVLFAVVVFVWGLNWPVTIDLILNAPFLGNADKEAILGGNAAKLLRIA